MRVASITANNLLTARQQIAQAVPYADVLELRLDYWSELNVEELRILREELTLPVLFTLRKKSQGGYCNLNEPQRLDLIDQLSVLLPDYIDLEQDVPIPFAVALKDRHPNIQLIRSYHDFSQTPDNLTDLIRELYHPIFSYFKIAVFAQTILDTLRLLFFMQSNSQQYPLIGIAMGAYGEATRILAPVVGSSFTYGSISDEEAAAPGQLTLAELTNLYRVHLLNRDTAIYALLGDPVRSSRGPLFHNAAFSELHKNAVYIHLRIPPKDLAVAITYLRQLPFCGFSITMPLKEMIGPLLDRIDAADEKIGAINTISVEQGEWVGLNTDGKGAIAAIAQQIKIAHKTLVILGAGGSAKAIAFEAVTQGATVIILNRTAEKAHQLAQLLKCSGGGLDQVDSLLANGYDVMINTLPPVINSRIEDFPLQSQHFLSRAIVMDIVYNEGETAFVQLAKAAGCLVVDGNEMFVQQAKLQQQRWQEYIPHF